MYIEEVKAHWDVYQTELVDQFYGGEPKAKKPLTVLRAPPGSIVVPGLAGTLHFYFRAHCFSQLIFI